MSDRAAQLREFVERAHDWDHPKGNLDYWSNDICKIVEVAATELELGRKAITILRELLADGSWFDSAVELGAGGRGEEIADEAEKVVAAYDALPETKATDTD